MWLLRMAKNASAGYTLSQCVTCETGYTPFNIGDSKKCYKSFGRKRLNLANSICVKEDATLPLPKNSKENTDVYNLLVKIRQYSNDRLVLDLTDVQNEGSFVSSNGQKQNFFNFDKFNFKNNEKRDYVAMEYNGVWWHHEGMILHMM